MKPISTSDWAALLEATVYQARERWAWMTITHDDFVLDVRAGEAVRGRIVLIWTAPGLMRAHPWISAQALDHSPTKARVRARDTLAVCDVLDFAMATMESIRVVDPAHPQPPSLLSDGGGS